MKENPLKVFVFLSPNLLGFLLFTLGPVFVTLGLSFYAWDMFGSPKFVGFSNYQQLLGLDFTTKNFVPLWLGLGGLLLSVLAIFSVRRRPLRIVAKVCALVCAIAVTVFILKHAVPWSPKLWQSLWNTFFLMLGLPLGMVGSLGLAVLLNEKVYGNKFFRLVYFLPSIVGGVGIFLLWKWIFNPDIGPVNYIIGFISGLDGPTWFESVTWAKPAIIIMGFWGSVGGTNMILYLAALQSVDPGLYEAAKIDGANAWHRFRHITVPMVSSTSFFILIMGIISGFQGGFESAYVITRGGPAGATTTVSYFIYENAFEYFEMGMASAISMLLFLLVLAMSWLNWHYASKRIHYS